MKIKLLMLPAEYFDPSTGEWYEGPSIPPLGLATLTSHLRLNSFSVDQDDLQTKALMRSRSKKPAIDLKAFNDAWRARQFFEQGEENYLESVGEDILKLTTIKGYDAVGFSLMNTNLSALPVIAAVLGKLIKEKEGPVILYGGYRTGDAERLMLSSGYIDVGVVGHGESSLGETHLLNFCRALEAGEDWRALCGLKYWAGGEIHSNPCKCPDSEKYRITTPTFDGLPLEMYRKRRTVQVGEECVEFRGTILPFFFMRGCPYRCAFCNHSVRPLVNLKDPAAVAAELKELSRKYKARDFFFHNPLVNPSRKFADALAKELISQDVGIRWTDCAVIAGMDGALLHKLKEAGAVRLVFGLESASPRVLEYIGKPCTAQQAAQVLKEAYKAGIWSEMEIICGFPYEREGDVKETISFLERHKKHIMGCMLHKFWIEGLIMKSPENYGIRFKMKESVSMDWSTSEWEEIDGLGAWERTELTNRMYALLRNAIDRLFIPHQSLEEIFLYSGYQDKWDEVRASKIMPKSEWRGGSRYKDNLLIGMMNRIGFMRNKGEIDAYALCPTKSKKEANTR